jgi:hypothetical protein
VHVRLVERLAVDVDPLVAQLERLAGQADDALDEVALRLLRVLEDDDVAAPDVADGQQTARSAPRGVGAKTNLFTSRWSPTSRLFSIEPVGILNACTPTCGRTAPGSPR